VKASRQITDSYVILTASRQFAHAGSLGSSAG